MNNYEEIKIESDVFANARDNFDLLLQRLFRSMEKNNSDEGSITLKVDLEMVQDWVPDEDGKSIEINKPVIKHKVSIAVPVKDSIDSKRDTGMNLVWNDDLNRYVLRYINAGGQRSLFDEDYEQNMKAADDELEVGSMLPGPSNLLPDNDGIIDADYQELGTTQNDGEQTAEPEGEEITTGEDKEAPDGCPEFSYGMEEDDYEYDEPRAEGVEENDDAE